MGYNRINWLKRIRQYANRITLTSVTGTTYDVAQVEGTVSQEGVPFTDTNMNAMDFALYLSHNTFTLTSAATDAYAVTIGGVTAYTDLIGIPLKFLANIGNTAACTLNVNALGAKNITKEITAALETGDILVNAVVMVVYDGTQFQLMEQNGIVTRTGTATMANKTLTAPKFATAGYIADANGNELIEFPATVASAVNHVKVTNAITAGVPVLEAAGGDANVGLDIKTKGIGSMRKYIGSLLSMVITATAAAVNYLTFNATATTVNPTITATGTDTNLGINLVPKGTGKVQASGLEVATISGTQDLTNKTLTAPKIASGGFIADANGNELIKVTSVASAVNEVTVTNSATLVAPQIQATGGDANINLVADGKGSGRLVDGTGRPYMKTTGDTMTGALITNSPLIFDKGILVKEAYDILQYTHLSLVTGTMLITLPATLQSTVLGLKIFGVDTGVTDVSNKNVWELLLGGFPTSPASGWSFSTAIVTGSAPFSLVRFGYIGSNPCILLGGLTSQWRYSTISIQYSLSGYTGWGIPTTGWTMSIITSEAGITISGTPVLQGSSMLRSSLPVDFVKSTTGLSQIPLSKPTFDIVAGKKYKVEYSASCGSASSPGTVETGIYLISGAAKIAMTYAGAPNMVNKEVPLSTVTTTDDPMLFATSPAFATQRVNGIVICTASGSIALGIKKTATVTTTTYAHSTFMSVEEIY